MKATTKPKYTFASLQFACKAKSIVCERDGKKIELTTPDGGNTAVCESLQEAVDTFLNDPAFKDLPVKKVQSAMDAVLAKSDHRIRNALAVLSEHHRGQELLKSLKGTFAAASGLDSCNGAALLALVEEFVKNHRRGFLS